MQEDHMREFVTLVTSKDCPGVSWGGQWYEAIDGRVKVPREAVPELTRAVHGNRVATELELHPLEHRVAQTLHLRKKA